ncbi:HIRAN domain-containing protein [Methanobrevibacter sp.]|uniref:HIRAN domain-containing protein n=1 Tax=Methanobrevibacter sp. TaxID=66852 RepID=UPI003890B1B0
MHKKLKDGSDVMTWEWKIGDPVDDANGGSMDAMNWGHGRDDEEGDSFGGRSENPKIMEYARKAYDLYMDNRDEEALHYINMALDLNDRHADNWDVKAVILDGMKRYAEAERCYNRSLELHPHNLVYDNKARMLYAWAVQLLEESKKLSNGTAMLNDANAKLTKAIRALPGENSEEDVEKYLKLRDSINFYIDYERKYQQNLERVKKYDKSELFTITGRQFHNSGVALTPGMPLRLVREADNEYDSDAVAVYAGDVKIGYVANNDYTKSDLTSSASELNVSETAEGSYLCYLDRYADIQFAVARLVK